MPFPTEDWTVSCDLSPTVASLLLCSDPKVYGDAPQLFVVPDSGNPSIAVNHIVVKMWGAGGGSANTQFSHGGAGGFVQVRARLTCLMSCRGGRAA